jgi:hypothetical protein
MEAFYWRLHVLSCRVAGDHDARCTKPYAFLCMEVVMAQVPILGGWHLGEDSRKLCPLEEGASIWFA